MADYSTIKGFTIQSLATDPYASEVLAGTWASGGVVNTARSATAGSGTQTAGLIAGGGPGFPKKGETEKYDGTSWTESGDLTTARENIALVGTQTASLAVGGYGNPAPTQAYLDVTETYDGTSWTEVADLNSARAASAGAGTTTAAIIAGGTSPNVALSEKWDGTSWTEVNNINTTRSYFIGGGTSTAGIVMGGSPNTAVVETYDGTSWSEVGDLNTARQEEGSSGNAPSTTMLVFGGAEPSKTAATESYDGTTWTEVADLATARSGGGGGGASGTSAFYATGDDGSNPTQSEEFSVPATANIAQEGQVWYNTTSTVLKGYGAQGPNVWSSGVPVNTGGNHRPGGGSSSTDIILAGGQATPDDAPPSYVENVEIFDGTAWTEVNNLSDNHSACAQGGTTTAFLVASGGGSADVPTGYGNTTESWDGTSWTSLNLCLVGRWGGGSGGTSSALKYSFGNEKNPSSAPNYGTNVTEDWDGTCWTSGTAMGRAGGRGATAAWNAPQATTLIMGGYQRASPPTATTTLVELWNGSAWTEKNDFTTARQYARGVGVSTAAMIMGGNTPPELSDCQQFDGTNWTTNPSMSTAFQAGSGGGSTTSALIQLGEVGGTFPTATEVWGGSLAIKTFTAT